ncbi:uncharacterized protein TNCV_3931641 [Trichonephila clavipes]|nr:uncharacterized protein TNCV_3931641 [Trichonephila clavipes]
MLFKSRCPRTTGSPCVVHLTDKQTGFSETAMQALESFSVRQASRRKLFPVQSPGLQRISHPQRSLRLAWTCQHRHWAVDNWKHVAWYYESPFQLNQADGRVRVWRKLCESMNPTCQQGTVQAGRGSMMVWSVCSWRVMGPLIRLDTTLISTYFRWPPNSPDMNITEYWDALQRTVQKRSPPPLTPTDLRAALQDP